MVPLRDWELTKQIHLGFFQIYNVITIYAILDEAVKTACLVCLSLF